MNNNIEHSRRGRLPLPTKNGLGPSRVRLPAESEPLSAWDFLQEVIAAQRHRHPDDNERALQERFDASEVVTVKGEALTPDSMILPNQDVFFYRIPAPEEPIPFPIETVYEDERILVVDKPPFMATMPRAAHITETATVRLRRATGNDELVPAHRLDRATSGLLLFTKAQQFRGAFQNLFAERKVHKIYEAVSVDRQLTPTTWENRIEKKPGQYQARIIAGEPNALTHLRSATALSTPENEQVTNIYGLEIQTLVRYTLEPVTGRTHQLRLHMHAAGVPILGDTAYPTPVPMDEEDISKPLLLRSRELAFIDPFTQRERVFTVGSKLVWA